MKKIFILGSTGSIGKNTLEVIRKFPRDFKIVGVAANTSYKLLASQAEKFDAKNVCLSDAKACAQLGKVSSGVKIYEGPKGLISAINKIDFDLFVNATVGFSGLAPTVEAIKKGADIALANKETLVVAGHIITKLIKKHKVNLVPIDSEHSAIFHLLKDKNIENIKRIILTASGGPFWNKKITNPSIKQVLNHPTWKMGSKITVDSATMMNKGFEVIEAHHLFGLPYDKIDVVIHPESIIHSMIETIDGEIYAQLSQPDMKLPIQSALTFPEIKSSPFKKLDLTKISKLTFYKPDLRKFPLLKLAYNCGKKDGSVLTILNAANEIAVSKFLRGDIEYNDIYRMIASATKSHKSISSPTLKQIINIDKETRTM